MSIVKKSADMIYAYRLVRLLQKPFTEWSAFKCGIINDKGSVLKRPKTDQEKESYSSFHAAVRTMKINMSHIPMMTGLTSMMVSAEIVANRFGMNEEAKVYVVGQVKLMCEEMVAGDSGGNATDIAAGKTSGAITLPGAKTMGKKIAKRKKNV